MKFVIYIHKTADKGPVAWEVWHATGRDDKCIASGVGFDMTQAMIEAGAVMVK